MKKTCEDCQQENATTVLNTVSLCDNCNKIEQDAIDKLHKLIGTMLMSGIPAKSILERFDLHNSLVD
jgi:hypothetical protein